MATLDLITQQAGMMGGKPCIRDMRVTVGTIVGQIGAGRTIEELLSDYPYLEHEDVLQASAFRGVAAPLNTTPILMSSAQGRDTNAMIIADEIAPPFPS